jgi:glutamine amidotransferase
MKKKSGPRLAVIDYDMGNLRSVAKALESVGCRVDWVEDASKLGRYDGLVLPGVGAFGEAMKNLKKRGLVSAIRKWIADERPFLGICLGYQLLFESSEEGRKTPGLGVFKGRVRRLEGGKSLKVPHIGWNRVEKRAVQSPIYRGIPEGSYFYFVHSYVPVPENPALVATTSRYGRPFASSIRSGNLFACQFHPEKSGETGMKLLRNFAAVTKEAAC